jgi:hypothetical protein
MFRIGARGYPARIPRLILAAVVAALLWSAAPAGAALGPLAPANPYTAANGAATMHGDAGSSDVSPFPGPGLGAQSVRVATLGAACPTILQGSDGIPIALCTAILDRKPTVYELNPDTGLPVASLALPASGNLFGGVYAYLDNNDKLVLFDAKGNLDRIGHHGGRLSIDSSAPTGLTSVVGIVPDWQGRVWFATTAGVTGFVDPSTEQVKTITLGDGTEHVDNSISSSPGGVAVATDHALYLLRAGADGAPQVLWRATYDRGPARKPGQLGHGTGATPTFFGPTDGDRYLAITDNAVPAEHLLVYDTASPTPSAPICAIPVLTPGPSGTENSPIGSGTSVFVASTYGYPYPASPTGAEPTDPASAPFTGGVTRVDLRADGSGCDVRWQVPVRSAAVPRLDLPDGLLYTISRDSPLGPSATSPLDAYTSVALDAGTGTIVHRQLIGATYASETLQLAPTIVPGRVLYQGTVTGITRIAPLTGP